LASEPPVNEAFLREVDDELRRDQIEGFWKRWGRMLVGGVIGLLAIWAGWLWWQSRQNDAQGLDGEEMSAAVSALEAGNIGAATPALAKLKDSKFDGYRATARMADAALALQRGDTKAAVATYGEVVGDTKIAAPWRDLALVRKTAAEFDTLKPEEVIARLKPLAAAGNPWFGSAGEMTAIAYLKSGKPELAAKLFADIAKDEQVPETIRSRAVQMAGVLGVDAVPPAKEKAQ
jgi:hypothetical protein